MFVAIIRKIVKGIDDWESVKEELASLAVQHKNYKLSPEYFDYLEASLIITFKSIAENEWNQELENAWRAYFKKIADVVKEKTFS
jgi:hemoglobin-like flavoprotein